MLRGGGDVELKLGWGMSGSRTKACWGRIVDVVLKDAWEDE
jgi:hypothetical protein